VIPDPPRKLGFDALWLAMQERPRSLLFGAVLVFAPFVQVFVFLMMFSPYLSELKNPAIRSTGKSTQGEVIRVEDVRGFPVDGVQPKIVFFRYQADGVERERSMTTLSVDKVSRWQNGQPIPVLYNDKGAIIDGLEPAHLPFLGVLMIISVSTEVLIAVALVVYAVLGIGRKYRLLKEGVSRQGKLISFEALSLFLLPEMTIARRFPELTRPESTGRFLATYSYLDAAGREVLGSAPSRDLTLLNGKKKGDPIEILVLASNERRSTILDGPAERVMTRR
jgi:hypothetical protein